MSKLSLSKLSLSKLTIAFAGTPAFGIPCLNALHASEHTLTALYTQPDRPAGRGRKMQPSAVKLWGEAHDLPIYQPLHFKDAETKQALADLKLDLLIVIAYGLLLPPEILALPRLGCINVHASILPRWRGASPIQQALLHGDPTTGITIMQMDKGMDTGAVFTSKEITIAPRDTTTHLHDTLADLAPEPLLETINALAAGHAISTPQDNTHATYAPKITKENARINWHNTAIAIDQQIRAFNPWPIATTQLGDVTLRIHQARALNTTPPGSIIAIDPQGITVATSNGALLIEIFQFPGGKAMPVADWLHAGRHQLDIGTVLL